MSSHNMLLVYSCLAHQGPEPLPVIRVYSGSSGFHLVLRFYRNGNLQQDGQNKNTD